MIMMPDRWKLSPDALQVLIRWQRSIIAGRLIVIVWEIR